MSSDASTSVTDADKGSRAIKSDIDRTRGQLDETVTALQEKLSPRHLIEQLGEMFTTKAGATASEGSKKVIDAIRSNPVPAALITLGAIWLIADKGSAASRARDHAETGRGRPNDWLAPGATYTPGPADRYDAGEHPGAGSGTFAGSAALGGRAWGASGHDVSAPSRQRQDSASSGGEGLIAKARHAVSDAIHGVSGAASGAFSSAGSRLHDARDGVTGSVRHLGEGLGRTTSKARRGIWDTYEANPLIVGGAAIALGVVAGMCIPGTRRENELMGSARDDMLAKGKEMGHQALEVGKQVAQSAVAAGREEATGQDKDPANIARNARQVIARAIDAGKDEVRTHVQDLGRSTASGLDAGTGGGSGRQVSTSGSAQGFGQRSDSGNA